MLSIVLKDMPPVVKFGAECSRKQYEILHKITKSDVSILATEIILYTSKNDEEIAFTHPRSADNGLAGRAAAFAAGGRAATSGQRSGRARLGDPPARRRAACYCAEELCSRVGHGPALASFLTGGCWPT